MEDVYKMYAMSDGNPNAEPRGLDSDQENDFEEDDGSQSQPPDLAQVGVSRNPNHQRREDQRRNDRLDQPQEDESQNAQMFRSMRPVVPDFRAQQHGDEDPRRKRPPQASVNNQCAKRDPAQSGKERSTKMRSD